MKRVNSRELIRAIDGERSAERTIGFVPTMGALHEGHLSLIRRAASESDCVVVSIFVNPAQFGPSEDFATYPRDIQGDSAKAEQAGADYLLAPEVQEVYPNGIPATLVEVGRIGEIVEGHFRPGHFNGVATVCVILFNLVRPERAYFGQKDAQQLALVRRVVRDLALPVEIVACPTVREPDGLATSSRNVRLDPESRRAAAVLSVGLFEAAERVGEGERAAEKLQRLIADRVATEPAIELQYVEVCDPDTFEPVEVIEHSATIALAAFARGTRLIDNVTVHTGGNG